MIRLVIIAATLLVAAGCEYPRPKVDLKWDYTPRQRDSIEFSYTHHYTENFNFKVTVDSLVLLPQSPADLMESLGDTAWVYRDDCVVVADIAKATTDTIDSMWIKIARDQYTIGWLREKDLMKSVVPDDPISEFIHAFGNRRTVALCCVAIIAVAVVLMRIIRRKKAKIVHFNDIDSIYPPLLCVNVAVVAMVYASIQHFVPQTWQEYYFHPTLNPFIVPPILALMITGVWSMILLMLASADDARHKMGKSDAVPYLVSLGGMMMVVYLVFAVSTMIYIGYALFVVYIVFAFKEYRKKRMYKYICGRCGHKLRHKGTCPFCGAKNV